MKTSDGFVICLQNQMSPIADFLNYIRIKSKRSVMVRGRALQNPWKISQRDRFENDCCCSKYMPPLANGNLGEGIILASGYHKEAFCLALFETKKIYRLDCLSALHNLKNWIGFYVIVCVPCIIIQNQARRSSLKFGLGPVLIQSNQCYKKGAILLQFLPKFKFKLENKSV